MGVATFTPEQLKRYFDHIHLPKEHRQLGPEDATNKKGLEFLQRLQRHQLVTVPWENLSQHYSMQLTPVLALTDPQDIFDKIVGSGKGSIDGLSRGGRGGVCFENNIFFGTILKSLGYNLYPVGGRVNHGTYFTSWQHMVNLVTIEGTLYCVDVGFGGRGQTQPLPLIEGQERAIITPAKGRLVKKKLPEQTDKSQWLWMYQYKSDGRDDKAEWEDKYAFTEGEFLDVDFQAMSITISYRRQSFFMHSLAMTRMVLASETNEDGDGIVGEMALTDNRIRRYIRGKDDMSEQFEKEEDRLNALKKWFGIELSEREKQGAEGSSIQLPA